MIFTKNSMRMKNVNVYLPMKTVQYKDLIRYSIITKIIPLWCNVTMKTVKNMEFIKNFIIIKMVHSTINVSLKMALDMEFLIGYIKMENLSL